MRNYTVLVGIGCLLACSPESAEVVDADARLDGLADLADALDPGTDVLVEVVDDVATPDAIDDGDAIDSALDATLACLPGTFAECAGPATVRRCNETGDEYAEVPCTDAAGTPTPCAAPGKCLPCAPGQQRCAPGSLSALESCDASGQWHANGSCDATTGKACGDQGCQSSCAALADSTTSLGCEFWAVDLDSGFVPGGSRAYYDAAGAQYGLGVVNPSATAWASVVVERLEAGQVELVTTDAEGGTLDLSPIPPQGARTLRLPPRNVNATAIAKLAYRLRSSAPVAVFQFNPLPDEQVHSADASLLWPAERLGKSHLVMSREQSFSILRGFVTVVATQAGKTNVAITLSKSTGRTLGSQDGKIKSFDCNPGSAAAACSGQFVLDQWDVLNVETDAVGSDLTGTVVVADARVAVFAGSEGANVPNTNRCLTGACSAQQLATGEKCGVCEWDGKTVCNRNEHCAAFITCCTDRLEMQMPAEASWGPHHVAVKFAPRGDEPDVWRVLARTDGTQVELSPGTLDDKNQPVVVPVLNRGQWFEFATRDSFELAASLADGMDAPVLLGHFMAGKDAPGPNLSGAEPGDAGLGDPSFSISIPVDAWGQRVAFVVPEGFSKSYISIALGDDGLVVLDGVQLDGSAFTTLPAVAKDASVPGARYARFEVGPGAHIVETSGPGTATGVGVEVYGYGPTLSYAYPGGFGSLGED
ncbi:MAG: IgGFc-binding protein [Myxococcota bacterium]